MHHGVGERRTCPRVAVAGRTVDGECPTVAAGFTLRQRQLVGRQAEAAILSGIDIEKRADKAVGWTTLLGGTFHDPTVEAGGISRLAIHTPRRVTDVNLVFR